MKVSEHFTLEELTFSQTATRKGIDNRPDPDVISNLTGLASFLEIVRGKALNPIIVSSGYRSPELNRAIGGSRTSAHMDGRAADITAPSFGSPAELAELIVALGLEFDTIILEFGRWVHVSVSDNPRHRILTAINADSGVIYKPGLEV